MMNYEEFNNIRYAKIGTESLQKLIAALKDNALTLEELSKVVGNTKLTARIYVSELIRNGLVVKRQKHYGLNNNTPLNKKDEDFVHSAMPDDEVKGLKNMIEEVFKPNIEEEDEVPENNFEDTAEDTPL